MTVNRPNQGNTQSNDNPQNSRSVLWHKYTRQEANEVDAK